MRPEFSVALADGIVSSEDEGVVDEVSEVDSDSGFSASHFSKIARSSCSVLKSRIPCPRSLMPGFRIHHSRSRGTLTALRAKLSWSS